MEETVPDEVQCCDQVFDACFHTKSNVLAVGLIDGSVDVWSYGTSGNKLLFKNSFHSSSCRGVTFSIDGETLYSISSDKSIQGIDGNGKQQILLSSAHDAPINKLFVINESLLVTGDDLGAVKLWDVRIGKDIQNWHLHEDFVSGFTFHQESNTLLSVSGDATLCAYDIRNANNAVRSDDQESELHCVQVIKGGKKVVCGSQDGVIQVFSWGRWGDCSDRFPGHPQTVDCMLKIDERTVFTGSSDGMLRVVQIQPNKVLGVIGDHEGFPVEGMCLSYDRRILASFAHDETIRFWDVSMFAEDVVTVESMSDDDNDSDVDETPAVRPVKKQSSKSVDSDSDEHWEDVDESDEGDGMALDSNGDEESSDDDIQQNSRKLPTKTEQFYSDL